MKGNLRLLNGRKLISPFGVSTRPTTAKVREALMNIIGEKIKGSKWLDLFSGSGVMGCEALQKGAQTVLAIESNKRIAQICEENLLNSSKDIEDLVLTKVVCCDVIKQLKVGYKFNHQKNNISNERSFLKFDIVYIDPPYESNLINLVLEELLKGNWIKDDSLVIYEHNSNSITNINDNWSINKQKKYGKTGLLFLTPSLA